MKYSLYLIANKTKYHIYIFYGPEADRGQAHFTTLTVTYFET